MDRAARAELLRRARAGDERAREELIREHRGFVAQTASLYCRRQLDWHNDDELSVSLIAFNEAIDSYHEEAGRSFLSYARLVIRSRLVDYYRKESRFPRAYISQACEDNEPRESPAEIEQAWQQYEREIEIAERAEELQRYQAALQEYGLTLEEVEEACPRHRDTRLQLMRVAQKLCSRQDLVAYLRKYRQLPVRELQALAGVSRKVLERGRKYIIALSIILTGEDYEHLNAFIRFPPAEPR